MRHSILACLAGLALVTGGCKDKPKEVTKAAQAEAAQLESEAVFVTQIREHSKAEGLLARAVELNPVEPLYWTELGASRRRQGNKDGAKQAYRKALDLHEAAYKRDQNDTASLLHQIETLILLRRVDEARNRLEKAVRDHPDDLDIRHFNETKAIDQMQADQALMALAI